MADFGEDKGGRKMHGMPAWEEGRFLRKRLLQPAFPSAVVCKCMLLEAAKSAKVESAAPIANPSIAGTLQLKKKEEKLTSASRC